MPECFRGPVKTLWRIYVVHGPLIAHIWSNLIKILLNQSVFQTRRTDCTS